VGWTEPVPVAAAEPEDLIAVRAAFGRLPRDQRAVIALHLYAGYSVIETAAIVEAPIETVRSRLRLAKDRLRRDLAEPQR
jgi:RNA polymerase sigma-70 factor (ECF subfamily)